MTSWFLSWICELDTTQKYKQTEVQQTEVQKKKSTIMSICTEKSFSKIQHLIFLKRFIYL